MTEIYELAIPDKIKIGGHTVRMEKSLIPAESHNKAEFSSISFTIRIDPAIVVTEEELSSCWIHELVHAIDYILVGGKKAAFTEEQVNVLAEGLLQIFQQLGINFVWGKE